MENINIEKIGINILEEKILYFGHMEPFLGQNDKTPGWDGQIYLYEKMKKINRILMSFLKGRYKYKLNQQRK